MKPRKPIDPPILDTRPPRKKRRLDLLRKGICLAGLGVLLLVLCLAGRRAVHPLFVISNENGEISTILAENRREHARHEALLARRRWLLSDAGVEAEARKYGYVKEGELALEFVPPAKPVPAKPKPKGLLGTIKRGLGIR